MHRYQTDPKKLLEARLKSPKPSLGGRSKACPGWDHRTNRAFALPAQTAILSRAARDFDIPGTFIGKGGEHAARYEAESGLVFKTNLPEQRRYGYVVDQGGDAEGRLLMLREALPSEYLLRLGLQNALFGDAIRLQAVAVNSCHADYPLIVTSQPYAGGEMPSLEDIAGLMRAAGFIELPVSMLRAGAFRSPVWYHSFHGVVASDATPGNFAKLDADVLAPVDLIVHLLLEELLRETARLSGRLGRDKAAVAKPQPSPVFARSRSKSWVSWMRRSRTMLA